MRQRIYRRGLFGLLLVLVVGCSSDPNLGSEGSALYTKRQAPIIRVMSRNLYIGADVDAAISALASPDPADDQPALLAAVQTFLMTDIVARAGAIAAEIEKVRPDVVGLQEVWYVNINLPGLVTVEVDFLDVLQNALADLGLNYNLATRLEATSATLPGIQLLDTDAVLVSADRVAVDSVDAQLFQFNIGDPGAGFEIVRGWTRVDATVAGQRVQFINTHLESGSGPQLEGLRAMQAVELASMSRKDIPVILVGDLNDVPGSPMYQVLTQAGFVDTWAAVRGESGGETCCHAVDLSLGGSDLNKRIDYVFTRGFQSGEDGFTGSVGRLGFHPSEVVHGQAYDLWPSDHLGLAAKLVAPGVGRR